MFDAATLKLFGAIAMFMAGSFLTTALLTGRSLGGRVITRSIGQFLGALVGLALGVVFLLAMG